MITPADPAPPRESLAALFARFLRFGLLAWGGPVAQIALIRQELVDEERWISSDRFNRVLSVYQVLPGPEATELCVYFGMLARGRLGGLLAGLGFVLPGFALMFALSWAYVHTGLTSSTLAGMFAGFQPAVSALVVRAIDRIGRHALTDRWLWAIAFTVVAASLLGAHFVISLTFAGLAYMLIRRGRHGLVVLGSVTLLTAMVLFSTQTPVDATPTDSGTPAETIVSPVRLFGWGLRTGMLTFGGAYTAIPFLRHDAVTVGGWMTGGQFLDGLALSGILPAPLIIFSTFVGYLGGGPAGALWMTLGVFLPAFAITLLGHDAFERLVQHKAAHAFLDGVTAGVVGLISVTAVTLFRDAVGNPTALATFLVALIVLVRWRAKAAVAVVVLGAGLAGLILFGGAA